MPGHNSALSTGSGRLLLTLFFPQGLLEERSNQIFFGEVGRQMVTGLMTKAEKVAGVGLLQIPLRTLPQAGLLLCFVLFCRLLTGFLTQNLGPVR